MAAGQLQQRVTKVPEIRAGDTVVVLTGKDAGKRGTVERVITNQQGHKKTAAKYGAAWTSMSPLATTAVVVEGSTSPSATRSRARAQNTNDRTPKMHPGRDPRPRPADAAQQGHARLHPLRQADPDRPQDARQRPPRPRLPPLRRAAGGASRDQPAPRALHDRGRAGAPEAVRVRQPDAGAEGLEDRRQHRSRRGADERQGARRGRRRPDDDHRPEADRDQGQALDRPVPAPDGQHDRGQGHPPRRADVGLPRAPHDARPAPHPRLPRRARQVVRRARQLHASGFASSSRSPRSNTTRWTVSAGWRSAS